jgi:signal peptidase II
MPVAVGLGVLVADQATKRMAENLFRTSDVVVIPGFFGFTYVENPGAAFSMFQNAGPFLGVAAILVTGFVLWMLRNPRPPLERVGLGLVIGGAMGNLADRIVRGDGILDGKVIDWINLWWIPTFNLADTAITVAVTLLLIESWRSRQSTG